MKIHKVSKDLKGLKVNKVLGVVHKVAKDQRVIQVSKVTKVKQVASFKVNKVLRTKGSQGEARCPQGVQDQKGLKVWPRGRCG